MYINQTDSTLADITAKCLLLDNLQRMNEKANTFFCRIKGLRSGKNPATEQELTLTEKNTERVLLGCI